MGRCKSFPGCPRWVCGSWLVRLARPSPREGVRLRTGRGLHSQNLKLAVVDVVPVLHVLQILGLLTQKEQKGRQTLQSEWWEIQQPLWIEEYSTVRNSTVLSARFCTHEYL